MDNFHFLSSGKECHNYILDKILNAKKIIFISSWQVDITYLLDRKNRLTLKDILLKKCKQGVQVYILTSIAPGTDCNNNNLNAIKDIKNSNFNMKILDLVKSSDFENLAGYFNILNNRIFPFKKCCKRLFHQRYFNVDNIHCIIIERSPSIRVP